MAAYVFIFLGHGGELQPANAVECGEDPWELITKHTKTAARRQAITVLVMELVMTANVVLRRSEECTACVPMMTCLVSVYHFVVFEKRSRVLLCSHAMCFHPEPNYQTPTVYS